MPDTLGPRQDVRGCPRPWQIDLASADSFEEQASEAVTEGADASVLIDLSGVTFIDSAGIRALVRVLELRSGKSLIVQPSPQVFTLLHLLALTDGVLPKVEILEPSPSLTGIVPLLPGDTRRDPQEI